MCVVIVTSWGLESLATRFAFSCRMYGGGCFAVPRVFMLYERVRRSPQEGSHFCKNDGHSIPCRMLRFTAVWPVDETTAIGHATRLVKQEDLCRETTAYSIGNTYEFDHGLSIDAFLVRHSTFRRKMSHPCGRTVQDRRQWKAVESTFALLLYSHSRPNCCDRLFTCFVLLSGGCRTCHKCADRSLLCFTGPFLPVSALKAMAETFDRFRTALGVTQFMSPIVKRLAC